MLKKRIIPILQISKERLVKTTKFKYPKYVGDPINAVKIFNEEEVDELIVLDIDATKKKVDPNYNLIRKLAEECRMPLCYGGGIKSIAQAEKIISLGVEKVAISSSAVYNPDLLSKISKKLGNQSMVLVLDVKKKLFRNKYSIYINNGEVDTHIDPIEFCKKLEDFDLGEIVINSIDKDGTMEGYDYELIEKLFSLADFPMTVLGGAGSLQHIGSLIKQFGLIGASAGSLFVFKGNYRAVLINYPNKLDKDAIFINNYLVS